MKKNIVLLILILTACSKPLFTSYSTKSNWVMVEKLNNPIYFKNLQKNVEVSIDNGKIHKKNDSTYIAIIDTLRWTNVILKKGKLIDSIGFKPERIVKPIFAATLDGFKKVYFDKISLSEFKKIQSFYPLMENYDYDCIFEIVSFDVIKIDKLDNVKRTNIVGHKTNGALSNMIRTAELDDTFVFDNIKIKFKNVEKEMFLDDVVVKLQY